MQNRLTLGYASLLIALLFILAMVFGRAPVVNTNSGIESDANPSIRTSVTSEPTDTPESFDIERILAAPPQYTGDPFVVVNNNIPLFTEEEIRSINTIIYSDLDDLGRCGAAVALIGPETLPTEARGQIGEIKPSGWHTVRYDDIIEDRYLYNRCHLLGYQLAGENAEPRNLITGTRYLNISCMLPFENRVIEVISRTGYHVLYRATPVFESDNLIASGVLLEAFSIEDRGSELQFFVYLFNVQPGIIIDYKTGESCEDSSYVVPTEESGTLLLLVPDYDMEADVSDRSLPIENSSGEERITFVLNTNTMRFHALSCPSVADIKPKNKEFSTESRDDLIDLGYIPCGRCNP